MKKMRLTWATCYQVILEFAEMEAIIKMPKPDGVEGVQSSPLSSRPYAPGIHGTFSASEKRHTMAPFPMGRIAHSRRYNIWSAPVLSYYDRCGQLTIREELTPQNGLLFKANAVVIPKNLRADMKAKIRSSYLGTEPCLRRIRVCIYWLGMSSEINP